MDVSARARHMARELDEEAFYESVAEGLRRQGWPRAEAEGEALERLERYRRNRDDI